jgi:hypothetical protein
MDRPRALNKELPRYADATRELTKHLAGLNTSVWWS